MEHATPQKFRSFSEVRELLWEGRATGFWTVG
jgi:hypothetical protein